MNKEERKEYDRVRYEANKELRKAQFRVQYIKSKAKKEEMRTKNEDNIVKLEGEKLAEYLAANAVKMVKALDAECYEECEELKAEKNQFVYTYINIMNLYRDIDMLVCIQELDVIYSYLIDRCKEEFANVK